MEHLLRSHLLVLAEALEAHSGITAATIGKRSINDNSFLSRVREGQGFTIKTYDRVVLWCADNWPDGLPWPESVPQPERCSA